MVINFSVPEQTTLSSISVSSAWKLNYEVVGGSVSNLCHLAAIRYSSPRLIRTFSENLCCSTSLSTAMMARCDLTTAREWMAQIEEFIMFWQRKPRHRQTFPPCHTRMGIIMSSNSGGDGAALGLAWPGDCAATKRVASKTWAKWTVSTDTHGP